MSKERTREEILDLIRRMQRQTVANGCTPAEAARFAAKAAEWVERYQIEEAELRAASGDASGPPDVGEVVQHTLRTGKRAFNPGMTAVVDGLARGSCCRVILLHDRVEAVYGVVGCDLDATYVCQIATAVVPALQIMATLDGREHGHERGALVRWSNQYLAGAGDEIRRRLESERKARSDAKVAECAPNCTALVVITGETLAVAKRAAVEEAFTEAYPRTRFQRSRTQHDPDAVRAGREAGKRVGLNVGVGEQEGGGRARLGD
jgi:hypothetical protein